MPWDRVDCKLRFVGVATSSDKRIPKRLLYGQLLDAKRHPRQRWPEEDARSVSDTVKLTIRIVKCWLCR